MNCDCIKNLEESLKTTLGDPLGKLDGMFITNEKSGKLEFRQTLTYFYRKKKKDGNFAKKESKLAVGVTNCPFCGKEL